MSASFTPPAGSLVTVSAGSGHSNTQAAVSFTVTDSGAHTWTQKASTPDTQFTGAAIYYCYFAASPGAITVTVKDPSTGTSTVFGFIHVLMGANPVQTSGALNAASSTSGSSVSGLITATSAGSMIIVSASVGNNAVVPSDIAGTTRDGSEQDGGSNFCWLLAGRGTSLTPAPGAAGPFGWTLSAAADYAWVAMEVLAAPVTFDAVGPSAAGAGAAASPLTWSHTCGAAATALYVGVGVGHAAASDNTFTVTATYNGIAMTALSPGQSANGSALTGNNGFIKVFKLASPPTGSALTVSVACSGTINALTGGSISVAASGAEGAPGVNFSASSVTSGSVSIPATTAGGLCLAFAVNGSGTFTWSSGTKRYEKDQSSSSGAGNSSGATLASPGGTASMTWTQVSDSYGVIGFEVQPPAAVPPDLVMATRAAP